MAHDGFHAVITDLLKAGHAVEAEARLLDRIIRDDRPLWHRLLGGALQQQGRYRVALAVMRRALARWPHTPDLVRACATAAGDAREDALAAELWKAAAEGPDGRPMDWFNLGRARDRLADADGAEAAYNAALAGRPDHPRALYNLANLLVRRDRPAEAVPLHERHLAVRPDAVQGRINLGLALRRTGRLDAARAAYDAALKRDPDNPEAHVNRATLALLQGRYAAGFAEWEWRRHAADAVRPPWSCPAWEGGDPAGRTLLLWNEQGLGDAVQFLRHVPSLAAAGARVLVVGPPALVPLAERVDGVARAVTWKDALADGGIIADAHAPLESLAHLWGPADPHASWPGPYVTVPPATLPGANDGRHRVGLVWSGNPDQPANRHRAVPARLLRRIAAHDGVHAFGLQVGRPAAEAGPGGALADCVTNLAPRLTDLAATAAHVAALDRVITVDTAVAHLCGALGRADWVLLSVDQPDWRWRLDTAATPFYPTLDLFRQPAPGAWGPVIDAVNAALDAPA